MTAVALKQDSSKTNTVPNFGSTDDSVAQLQIFNGADTN